MYLAIDANLELAEEEDCFDVFGYLKKLRQSRKGLIENEVISIIQYIRNGEKKLTLKFFKLIIKN